MKLKPEEKMDTWFASLFRKHTQRKEMKTFIALNESKKLWHKKQTMFEMNGKKKELKKGKK